MRKTILLPVLVLSGCQLYWGGDDDNTRCDSSAECPAGEQCVFDDMACRPPGCGHCEPVPCTIPAVGLRNPQTGVCDFSYGDCTGYDYAGAEGRPAADLWWPDWAYCSTACDGLDEATCLATDGCRAIYTDPCPTCDYDYGRLFAACWATAPSGPIRGGGCSGLDAHGCSRHDDCVAVHDQACCTCPAGVPCDCAPEMQCPGNFLWCSDEAVTRGCYGDQDCLIGEHCTAADMCLPPPGCTAGRDCLDVCYGWCEPGPPPPAECASDAECALSERCNEEELCLPPPDCPPGAICEGCWGYCVPVRPECASDSMCPPDLVCNAPEVCLPPPDCGPDGGCEPVCWGYCVPPPAGCCCDSNNGQPCPDDCRICALDEKCDPATGQCVSEPPPPPPDCCCDYGQDCIAECAICSASQTCDQASGQCVPTSPPACCCDPLQPDCLPSCTPCAADERCDPAAGVCVPNPPPPPACADIWDEAACIDAGCQPIYEGVSCGCDETGCWCEEWVFLACRTPQ